MRAERLERYRAKTSTANNGVVSLVSWKAARSARQLKKGSVRVFGIMAPVAMAA